jgi:hypothetical protein
MYEAKFIKLIAAQLVMQEHYVPDLSGQIWNLMRNSHFHSSHSHIHLSADSKISQSVVLQQLIVMKMFNCSDL